MKGLDNENLETKEQDIEGDSRRWEDFPCPQIENKYRENDAGCNCQVIWRFPVQSLQNPAQQFFTERVENNPEFSMDALNAPDH